MLAIVKFIVVMATAGLLLAEDLDLDLSELADELGKVKLSIIDNKHNYNNNLQ